MCKFDKFRIGLLVVLTVGFASMVTAQPVDRKIVAWGNGMEVPFIQYVAEQTGKKNPEVCFILTASGENPRIIQYVESLVKDIRIKPKFLITFISSEPSQETFADQIFSSDAIIVGGGNTLNMLGIWKAQGIDTLLYQAYEKGIVLAGGSAGSLCWFEGGYSDSRPQKLTILKGLGFLPYSHSCHHNQPVRKELYLDAVASGKLSEGYACEDGAGLFFVNGKMKEALAIQPDNKNFFISADHGKLHVEELSSTRLQ